jgi:hypothetical protein
VEQWRELSHASASADSEEDPDESITIETLRRLLAAFAFGSVLIVADNAQIAPQSVTQGHKETMRKHVFGAFIDLIWMVA